MLKQDWPTIFSHLTARLVLSFTAVVLTTTFVAAVPAYWLIQNELDRQAWSHVDKGQQVTEMLFRAEEERLANLAVLIAERPTLQRLLQEPTPSDLSDYLARLQASVDLDMLAVKSPSGEVLAGDSLETLQPATGVLRGSGLYWIESQPKGLAFVAIEPVVTESSRRSLGFVVAGILLDDEFTARLASETGFAQRILLYDVPLASSIPTFEEIRLDRVNGQPNQYIMTDGTKTYYASRTAIPLVEESGEAAIEIALPVNDVLSTKQRALRLIVLSTALVALLGSGLGILLARRMTTPLEHLTAAARTMSQGDLTTPIPVHHETVEISTLANALERSRENVQRMFEELLQAKVWSETLISSIVEGVVTFDSSGYITFFSDGASRILGLETSDAVGKPIMEMFRLADSTHETFLAHIPPHGMNRQVNVLAHDNRPMTLAITGAQLAPPGTDDVQVALVFRDVTEEEATRNLRTYFLANITHEFRTPLAALSASIELLLDEAEALAQPGMIELTRSLHLSVLNLQTLINNLLQSSSIEAGRFTIRHQRTEINEVIGQALSTIQPLLARRQQSCSLTEPTALVILEADPTRLEQVLINLLSNASNYSPPGSAIDIVVEKRPDQLRVAVLDRGPGISQADRKDLFRLFVRLSGDSGEQYGIGLGLSVAKAIIEGHGGEIGVDSRPGGGSVFWFRLPLRGDT